MKTLTIEVPDSVDVNNKDLAFLLASQLYEQGKLSLGQAAAIAGFSKRAFAELLGTFNISLFNGTDLANDVGHA